MTDGAEPLTTVVIPVWDRYVTPHFSAALASVLGQDVPVVVVVVDNASTEPLPEMAGVQVVRSSQRVSLGAARNIGLNHTRTELVLFADADDILLPGAISSLERELIARPELVAAALAFIDADTGQRHRWPRPWIGKLVRYPVLTALLNAVWAIYPITGPVLIRTAVARAAGGHADLDNGDARCLGAALLFRGPVGWSEQPGWVYHQRPGSNLDRFSGAAAILASARSVRARLRSDGGTPPWVASAMPLIAAAQYAAVAAHLALAALRRAARVRRGRAQP